MPQSLVLAVGAGIGLFIAYALFSLSKEKCQTLYLSPVSSDCVSAVVPLTLSGYHFLTLNNSIWWFERYRWKYLNFCRSWWLQT